MLFLISARLGLRFVPTIERIGVRFYLFGPKGPSDQLNTAKLASEIDPN